MTIQKIDMVAMSDPSVQSSFNGLALKVVLQIATLVNALIDALDPATVSNQLATMQQTIAKLTASSNTSISDVGSSPINASILNLAAVQALDTKQQAQSTAINQILAAFRSDGILKT